MQPQYPGGAPYQGGYPPNPGVPPYPMMPPPMMSMGGPPPGYVLMPLPPMQFPPPGQGPPPMGPADRPCTLYVGKIPDSVDDATLKRVLEACGMIISWKRPSDPITGKMKAFGLCEFRSGAHASRAIRVLAPLTLQDGVTLLVKVDTKTQAFLDTLEGANSSYLGDAEAKARDDDVARAAVEVLLGIDVPADAHAAPAEAASTPPPGSGVDGAEYGAPAGAPAADVDPEERERVRNEESAQRLMSELVSKAGPTAKEAAVIAAASAVATAAMADEDPRERERARRRARDAQDRLTERALARKREVRDRERADEREYSDRLRDVEKREDRLERRHEREQERAAERQRVLDEPNALDKLGAKAREDLRARRYDEKRADDADVRAERRAVEAEAEKADRERRDVERAAERVAERAERDAERAARAERDAERAERERRHPPRRKEEGEPGELSDGEAEPEREAAKPRADGGDGGERASSPPHAAAASESEGEGGADDDIMGQLAQEVHARRTAGGTTHDIAPGEDGEAPPPMLTGAQPIRLGLGGSRKRQTPAAFATGAEGEDKQKRKLEKLEYTEAEEAAVAQAPSKQREKAAAEKEKLAKIERARTLVARIPVEQEALFAFEIDWGALERKGVLEAKLRPWISKKLQEYVGDEDVSDMVGFVVEQLRARGSPAEITEQLAMVLDDEAQAFCAKLWRMLAFEALSAGS